MLATIFKRLISIDQKPDITLTLINDEHYQDFFGCLSHLEENKDISFNLKKFFGELSCFNNYLDIDNVEIISNINNNFRIIFLKDYIFPTFLTDRQIEELNTFLFLHNNTIICHINTIMRTKMNDIDQKIDLNPFSSHDFFNELFVIFKTTFGDLKMNFVQNFLDLHFHFKIVDLLRKNIRIAAEDPFSAKKGLVTAKIQVCVEVISFLCRNSQRALIEIFSASTTEFPPFLEDLPLLLETTSINLYKEILDIFLVQSVARNDAPDSQFRVFALEKVIPFLANSVKRMAAEKSLSGHLRFVFFAVELFNTFHTFKVPSISEALAKNSFLDLICDLFSHPKKKITRMIFLKYLKETLIQNASCPSLVNWKRVFICFWSCYLRNYKRRCNLLHSLCLSIFRQVSESENFKLVKQFVKTAKKFSVETQNEDLLRVVFEKYEQLKSKIMDPELDLTSESENSFTNEKCKFKVKETFLENETKLWHAKSNEKDGKEHVLFSTPKDIQDLFRRIGSGEKKVRDEMDLTRVIAQPAVNASVMKITLDENLLGKRANLEEQ